MYLRLCKHLYGFATKEWGTVLFDYCNKESTTHITEYTYNLKSREFKMMQALELVTNGP